MKNLHGGNGKPPNKSSDVELRDVGSFMRALKDKIQKLHETVARLPKVDSKGYSECPFAERLYAEKEELLQEFELSRNQIPDYLNLIDQEIARFQQNLNQLPSGNSAFNTPQTTQQMKTARESYEFHYKKHVDMKRELTQLATQADRVIAFAVAKQWPLGKPEKRAHYSIAPINTMGPASNASPIDNKMSLPSNAGPSVPNELDNLLSLGPMKNAGFINTTP